MAFHYGTDHLDLDTVNGIANGSIAAILDEAAVAKIQQSRACVEETASAGRPVA